MYCQFSRNNSLIKITVKYKLYTIIYKFKFCFHSPRFTVLIAILIQKSVLVLRLNTFKNRILDCFYIKTLKRQSSQNEKKIQYFNIKKGVKNLKTA